ncbi:zf-HC2 domain-containing protein [Yinghuangia sp. ASG 101]|uniref:anti-sigma factor family protein n=1 Tax=Yinghuangia sp. ASG 101 TaxID=2896848 RepID=UPI001E5BD3D2|nr:zf-HC2 domain-containing protein [Yinghuangia sp. ASG 101]UGQ09482.1 zf-HC2 domain-containing protein [Yinghuangia sp. ASG 101]
MNHPDDKLAAYVDGELGHGAREKVLAHLAQCADCRAEAEEQRRVKALLAKSPEPGPSADLMSRLLALGAGGVDGPGPGTIDEDVVAPTRSRGSVQPVNRGAGTARPRGGGTGPRAGRPNNPSARVRPPVSKRRLTFAAAGAFSMMAVALSSAVIAGGPANGSSGRPAAPIVERNLVEQAGTVGVSPTVGTVTESPAMLAAGAARPLSAVSPTGASARD